MSGVGFRHCAVAEREACFHTRFRTLKQQKANEEHVTDITGKHTLMLFVITRLAGLRRSE